VHVRGIYLACANSLYDAMPVVKSFVFIRASFYWANRFFVGWSFNEDNLTAVACFEKMEKSTPEPITVVTNGQLLPCSTSIGQSMFTRIFSFCLTEKLNQFIRPEVIEKSHS